MLSRLNSHRRQRRFLSLGGVIILLSSLCGFSTAGEPASFADVLDQVRPSVVAVGTLRPIKRVGAKNLPVTFRGTGFVVGNGEYLITNVHVIPEKIDTAKDETLAVFSGRGKQAKSHEVSVVATDPIHDLALLRLKVGRLPALSVADDNFLREGSDVAFTGFPLGMVLGLYPVTNKTIVSAITPFVMPALSSTVLTPVQIKRLKQPFEVYQLDAIAYPGNSGSPVFDNQSGRVIGVVNSVFVKESKESLLDKPSAITYAIPVKYVRELLQQVGQ